LVSEILYRLVSFRDLLPGSRYFVLPSVITGFLVLTWAAFASAVLSPVVAAVLASTLGGALFAAWLRFAYDTSRQSRKASENLLNQLSGDGRTTKRLGIYDSNSGLFNRTYLELRLHEETQRCDRYGHSMALVVLRFGRVPLADLSTDSWAPTANRLGRDMAQTVRSVDITAALGPGEFAICLVHCDRAGADKALKRVLRGLEGEDLEVGVVVHPEDGIEASEMVEIARDRARNPARTELQLAA
jgi:GGDEF domain-containing protein